MSLAQRRALRSPFLPRVTYRNRAHLILFCECEQKTTKNEVTVFPIQQAYSLFFASKWRRIALDTL